ncbi:filamentous hemagglutinin N-terminal domain-containing protein [Cyanobacteria bacterium FACHB-471]|nr:filamentous hemagglutinin N-terminal domain-containing protein [Cyanobacteria bacterium FACHB-471]
MRHSASERNGRLEFARVLAIATSIIISTGGIVGDRVLAQITPDSSLGSENSQIFRDASGRLINIGGGAARGANLFHSFTEFNVGGRQQVYFTNPVGIENILSRVTGNDPSEILGTLGVNGNANLFLLNPNGILFGRNARLDIAGSFVATTADRFSFNNGLEFSAVDPELPPLLTVTLNPGVQLGRSVAGGTITNRGSLTVGQDLSLIAETLNLSGQLQAGKTLTLRALDTVWIHDRPSQPFLASAGGNLQVQGDRRVNIFALNHSNSGFFAGEDLVLRSANSVQGDAHYTAGNNFRIEQLNGQMGSLSSPYDPVIRANGNVSFTSYTGASLHIFAGGAVNIGRVEITGADATNSVNETVVLSDGSTLQVNGAAQPSLDIRAGTTAVGTPLGVTGIPSPTGLNSSTATSANITIGEIVLNQPDGLIFLTNQYQPNNSLNGTIEIGFIDAIAPTLASSVTVDTRSGIVLNNVVDVSGVDPATNFITGDGGNVTFLAAGDIRLNEGAAILSEGLLGGNIQLNSEGALTIRGTGDSTTFAIASNTFTDVAGASSGDIEITAQSLSSTNAGNIAAITFGAGEAGNITINTDDFVSLNNSEIVSVVELGATGSGGDINVITRSLSLSNVSGLVAVTLADGQAGNVNIFASESTSLNDSQIASFVNPEATGQGGSLNLNTQSLLVTNGAQVNANTLGLGDAGQVRINAADSIVLDGISANGTVSGVFSNVFNERDEAGNIVGLTEGNGGNIDITTRSLSVLNGAQINASTEGRGDAGNINLDANSVLVTGSGFDSFQNIFSPSAIVSEVLFDADGAGGDIGVNAANLEVSDSGRISASTDGFGNAGSLDLDITDSVTLTGATSGLFADTIAGSSGNGGSIFLTSRQVLIQDGASIAVGSEGFGVGGNIQLEGNSLFLNRGLISARTASTTGGNITLNLADTVVLRRESEISTTAGTAQAGGDGGNITINTDFLAAVASENSDITANAFQGQGGNINITAIGVFGIAPRESQTELSDITASSEFGVDGVIEINRPDVDPSRGTAELPADVVDASRLVAQGCSAGNTAIANQIGEFTITGRGGLPPSPTEQLNSDAILADWETLEEPTNLSTTSSPIPPTHSASASTELVEAQGWAIASNGQLILTAQATAVPHSPWVNSATCRS